MTANSHNVPARFVEPVAEYDHTGPNGTVNGEAIVGGYVSYGSALPQLNGRYVFGDYSPGADEGKAEGRLFVTDGKPWRPGANTVALPVKGDGNLGLFLLGFGTDSDGGLYVLGNKSGTLQGQTGVVQRITSG